MRFNERLQKLRKERSLSQEQLADNLGVSRQAVSKWESGSSYPETEKLIELSKLFSVSIDELLKEEPIKEQPIVDPLKVEEYIKFNKKFALAMASGVVICIIALIVTGLCDELFHSEIIDISVFFGIVSVALMLFIYYGIQSTNYEEIKKQIKKIPVKPEIKKSFQTKFAIAITVGVVMCIVGLVAGAIIDQYKLGDGFIGLGFFGFVAIGVYLFIYYGIQSDYYMPDKPTSNESLVEKISGVIMLVATIIFLVCGFLWGNWHPGWIVFVVGGILCGIVSVIFEKEQ